MGMTQDTQKALGPQFPGGVWNPDPPKNTQLWCQPGLLGPLPSMAPSRVTVGVKWDTAQQQVTKKPSLLPPAFGPLPLRLRPEPCCAPSPGTPDRAPVSPTVPRACPLIPCAGAFSRPRGNVESTPTSPGVTGKNRIAWGQRQGSPCCTDIPQGSHELRLMSRPWGGHRSVLPCTFILYHSCSAPSTVWAGLNQPGSEPGHQQLWPQAELSSLCEVDQEPSTGGG